MKLTALQLSFVNRSCSLIAVLSCKILLQPSLLQKRERGADAQNGTVAFDLVVLEFTLIYMYAIRKHQASLSMHSPKLLDRR